MRKHPYLHVFRARNHCQRGAQHKRIEARATNVGATIHPGHPPQKAPGKLRTKIMSRSDSAESRNLAPRGGGGEPGYQKHPHAKFTRIHVPVSKQWARITHGLTGLNLQSHLRSSTKLPRGQPAGFHEEERKIPKVCPQLIASRRSLIITTHHAFSDNSTNEGFFNFSRTAQIAGKKNKGDR